MGISFAGAPTRLEAQTVRRSRLQAKKTIQANPECPYPHFHQVIGIKQKSPPPTKPYSQKQQGAGGDICSNIDARLRQCERRSMLNVAVEIHAR
jgi:hypothetical protein